MAVYSGLLALMLGFKLSHLIEIEKGRKSENDRNRFVNDTPGSKNVVT